jgi:hypothetical protein
MPLAEFPAGTYQVRCARSYGTAGRVRVGDQHRALATLHVGGLRNAAQVFTHTGGKLGLACDDGVNAVVALRRLSRDA